ncbi:MAG: response regulator [bacterium]|nr:MAG: response regulator [bacterium]
MSKVILVVDPSRSSTRSIKVVVSRMGFSCVMASGADEALDIMQELHPDLIISDANLPDMECSQFLSRLKGGARTSRIPVVILSGEDGTALPQQGSEVLLGGYLRKPVSARDLHRVLQRHLAFPTRRRHLRAPLAACVRCRDGFHHRTLVTLNMGEGGMFLETGNPQPRGTVLDMELLLPGLEIPVPLKGEVVYVVSEGKDDRPAGVGIRFVDLDHDTRSLLTHYMESYLTDTLP